MMTDIRLATSALIPNVEDKVVNVWITYQHYDVKNTKIDIHKQDEQMILRQLSKIKINREREAHNCVTILFKKLQYKKWQHQPHHRNQTRLESWLYNNQTRATSLYVIYINILY